MTDHIEIYENALSANFCTKLISKFDASDLTQPGCTGTTPDKKIKDSRDLILNVAPGWEKELQTINENVTKHFMLYARKYAYLMNAHVGKEVQNSQTGETITLTPKFLKDAPDEIISNILNFTFRPAICMLQKYNKNTGGFHAWHSEISPGDPQGTTIHRVLFYIYYLNDITQGGETEFLYQKRKVAPETGRMIISPAGFTHAHKGHIAHSADKYILTSWIMYKPYEMVRNTK